MDVYRGKGRKRVKGQNNKQAERERERARASESEGECTGESESESEARKEGRTKGRNNEERTKEGRARERHRRNEFANPFNLTSWHRDCLHLLIVNFSVLFTGVSVFVPLLYKNAVHPRPTDANTALRQKPDSQRKSDAKGSWKSGVGGLHT